MICKECAWEADFQKTALEDFHEPLEVSHLTGHAVCSGCTCQHKPVKEGQIER